MQLYLVVEASECAERAWVLEDNCKVYFWNVEMLIKETLLVAFPNDTEEQ